MNANSQAKTTKWCLLSDAKCRSVIMELLKLPSCTFCQETLLEGERDATCSGRSHWGPHLETIRGKQLMTFGLSH